MRGLSVFWVGILILCLVPSIHASREPVLPAGHAGSKSAALGGAGTALPGSAESLFSNPAALSQIRWLEVSSSFGNQDLGDGREAVLAGVFPLAGRLVAGASFMHRAFPRGPQNETDVFSASLAFPLTHNGKFLTGVTAKYFIRQETISTRGWETSRGAGVDLGLLYEAYADSDDRAFQMAVAILDPQTNLKNEHSEIQLPVVVRAGMYGSLGQGTRLVLGYDVQSPAVSTYERFQVLRAGVEQTMVVSFLDACWIRAGYERRLDQTGIATAGVGAEYADWRVDYALQIPAAFSDVWHQLTLSWGWQRSVKSKEVYVPEPVATPETKSQRAPKQEDRLFSALSIAAEVEEGNRKSAFEEGTPTPTATPTSKIRKPMESRSEDEGVSYHLNVPQSPADEEKTTIAPELEVPGTFSNYMAGIRPSRDNFKIINQDLRLHVVVNPFSPNRDGRQDRTIFVGRVESERLRVARWVINVLQGDQVFRSFRGGSRMPHNLEWDGSDARGKILPDGTYDILLRVFDETGLEISAATQPVVLRTKIDPIKMTVPELVTLTGDREQDKPVLITVPKLARSSDWRLVITDPRNRKVFDKSAGGEVPEKFAWAPRMGSRVLSSGKYRLQLTYRDEVGLKGTSDASLKIGYAEFSVELKAAPLLFKPGANPEEGVTFTPEIQGEIKISRWTLTMYEVNQERALRILEGEGVPPATIVWDGKDQDGKDLPGGKLIRAVLTVQSAVGTEETAEAPQLQSDLGAYTGKQALTINLVRVTFASEAADISEIAMKSLLDAAKVINQYKTDYSIRVLGYCDQKEAKGRETELSRLRAQKVLDYLVREGKIAAEKIQSVGYGNEKPLSTDPSDTEQMKNRRVEVVLFAK